MERSWIHKCTKWFSMASLGSSTTTGPSFCRMDCKPQELQIPKGNGWKSKWHFCNFSVKILEQHVNLFAVGSIDLVMCQVHHGSVWLFSIQSTRKTCASPEKHGFPSLLNWTAWFLWLSVFCVMVCLGQYDNKSRKGRAYNVAALIDFIHTYIHTYMSGLDWIRSDQISWWKRLILGR